MSADSGIRKKILTDLAIYLYLLLAPRQQAQTIKMATSYYLFVILQLLSIFSVVSEYSIKLEMENECNQKKSTYSQYYDTTHLKCRSCSQNKTIQSVSSDGKYLKNNFKVCFTIFRK